MAQRVSNKLKAQLITVNADDTKVKRNFNNVRTDISDADLQSFVTALRGVLHADEKLDSVNLTTNASLSVKA